MIVALALVWERAVAQTLTEGAKEATSSAEADPATARDIALPIDYKGLSHNLQIELFRGGSYEKEGVSRYYFKVTLLATQSSKTEGSDGKKMTTPVGSFGEMSLKSLDMWKRDDKAKGGNYEQRIDGDLVRDSVARAMLEWVVPENEVQIGVQVELWRHAKRFGLLGEDAKVADATYQLIPQASDPAGQVPAIVMSDAKGTMVRLLIKFDRDTLGSKDKKDK